MTSEQQVTWIRPFYPAFSGLRGLAVAMVFFNHYGPMIMPPKLAMTLWPGVDLFFVLSGFLITGILFDSRHNPDRVRDFYVRRFLRIFPVYYAVFGLFFLFRSKFSYDHSIWSNLLYVSNLTRLHPDVRNPTFATLRSNPIFTLQFGTYWSLCVEEQFYLTWPWVVWVLEERRSLMRVCEAAIAAGLLLRLYLYNHNPVEVAYTHYLYFFTPTRCGGLFIGAWLALWLRGKRLTRHNLRLLGWTLVSIPSAVLTVGEATVGRRWVFDEVNPLLCTYGYTLISLVAAGILLLSLDDSSIVSRVFRLPFLAALGAVSYGFYLFHAVLIGEVFWLVRVFDRIPHVAYLVFLATFACTWALAWLSFRFFESPILRLKDRWAPR